MNKRKCAMLGLGLILGIYAFKAQAGSSSDVSADKIGNPDQGQQWREILQKYRQDAAVKQVLLVRCTGGSSAKAQFYRKITEYNNAWTLVFEEDAYIGKNGTGKTKEGDGKTPIGEFGITKAFGILPDPGSSLEYIDITRDTYSCDEDCEYYNQIIHTEETGHHCTGEEMYSYTPEYNYGIVLDYNSGNVYPKGSAIYLHCKGVKKFTGGCIAVSEGHMKTILEYADQGMKVCIGKD